MYHQRGTCTNSADAARLGVPTLKGPRDQRNMRSICYEWEWSSSAKGRAEATAACQEKGNCLATPNRAREAQVKGKSSGASSPQHGGCTSHGATTQPGHLCLQTQIVSRAGGIPYQDRKSTGPSARNRANGSHMSPTTSPWTLAASLWERVTYR